MESLELNLEQKSLLRIFSISDKSSPYPGAPRCLGQGCRSETTLRQMWVHVDRAPQMLLSCLSAPWKCSSSPPVLASHNVPGPGYLIHCVGLCAKEPVHRDSSPTSVPKNLDGEETGCPAPSSPLMKLGAIRAETHSIQSVL